MSEPPTPRLSARLAKQQQQQQQQQQQRLQNYNNRSEGTLDATDKSRKFFTTWRMACDKTKDKTKELLKRTLSWKGQDYSSNEFDDSYEGDDPAKINQPGWKVHVWTATLVRRSSTKNDTDTQLPITLSPIQSQKLSHFFHHLLDIDHDELICAQDFESLTDRLRLLTNWSSASQQFSILKQIQQEFVRTFIPPSEDQVSQGPASGYIELEDWLRTWSSLLKNVRKINELPFWLQQLPKMLFLAINRSGSGVLRIEELKTFFTFVVGVHQTKDDELEAIYKSWTANGDFQLKYPVYELCFANWLLCKNPNGPGQWLFGKCGARLECFPIDYSAMNTPPEDRETYSPHHRSNRYSVVV